MVKSLKNVANWNTDSDFQNKKIKKLNEDLEKFIKFLNEDFSFVKNGENLGYGENFSRIWRKF